MLRKFAQKLLKSNAKSFEKKIFFFAYEYYQLSENKNGIIILTLNNLLFTHIYPIY